MNSVQSSCPIPAAPAATNAKTNHDHWVSTEPRHWVCTFDSLDGWSAAGGWELTDNIRVVAQHGTDGRQAFTRADGTFAHVEAASAPQSILRSPTIDLAGLDTSNLELRADINMRTRGHGEHAGLLATFDDDETHVLWTGDETQLSDQLRLKLHVPQSAQSVFFEWVYNTGAGDGSLSIDNMHLVSPLPPLDPATQPLAVIDVFSDVQGATDQMAQNVMPGFTHLEPAARTLVVNGDLVECGQAALFDEYFEALNTAGRDRYDLNISTMGNHEYHHPEGSPDDCRERFLGRTDMRDVGGQGGLWGEVLVDQTLPVLWIGSEGYDYPQHTGRGPFMHMSDRQYQWLRGRLEHYASTQTPVLLFSHFVFANSISGTYISMYAQDATASRDYDDGGDRLGALLQAHPNVTLVNSHTHWDMRLNDWAAEKRFDPNAPVGTNIFNSGAVTTQYGPKGDWEEAQVGNADPTGLRVCLYPDRVRVDGYSFAAGGQPTLLQTLDVPVSRQFAQQAQQQSGEEPA